MDETLSEYLDRLRCSQVSFEQLAKWHWTYRQDYDAWKACIAALVEACRKFSAAHFNCNGEDCTDAHCDPQDWAEFDAALAPWQEDTDAIDQ